ncbi:MAG: lysoplasmalogenase family protein [Anaerolineae bacterium]
MLPLPYAEPFATILYVLLGLDLALLLGGLLFGRPDALGYGRLPLPLRMGLSVTLVAAALIQAGLAKDYPWSESARLVAGGMVLGLLGDLIMAGLIRVPDRLVFGMAAFGLGHLAYMAALLVLLLGRSWWDGVTGLGLLLLVAALAVVLWAALVRKPRGDRFLNGAALGYSLLLAGVNALALNLALHSAAFIPLAVGAALFLASDLVLGRWAIRGLPFRGVNDVVWVTYNLGQLLIVFSIAAAG